MPRHRLELSLQKPKNSWKISRNFPHCQIINISVSRGFPRVISYIALIIIVIDRKAELKRIKGQFIPSLNCVISSQLLSSGKAGEKRLSDDIGKARNRRILTVE